MARSLRPVHAGAPADTVIVTSEILPAELERLVDSSIPVMIHRPNEEAVVLGGLFAGALIALGIASLAIGSSSDRTYQRKLAHYFLVGHLLLGFTVWVLTTIWSTLAGFIILDLLIWPVPVLVYRLLSYRSGVASRTGALSSTEQEIREAAGQEERNIWRRISMTPSIGRSTPFKPTSRPSTPAGITMPPARVRRSNTKTRRT